MPDPTKKSKTETVGSKQKKIEEDRTNKIKARNSGGTVSGQYLTKPSKKASEADVVSYNRRAANMKKSGYRAVNK